MRKGPQPYFLSAAGIWLQGMALLEPSHCVRVALLSASGAGPGRTIDPIGADQSSKQTKRNCLADEGIPTG